MRILWLKTELLHPVDKGGKIRTYQMLKELKREHHVTYLTLDDGAGARDAQERATEYCQELVRVPHSTSGKFSAAFYRELALNAFSRLPYAVKKYESAAMRREIRERALSGSFDLLVCDFLAPSVNVPQEIACPTVLFEHNVEELIWKRHYEVQSNPLKRAYLYGQWRKMRAFERAACRRFDQVIAVSREDSQMIAREYGVSSVKDVPTGVDTEYFRPLKGENEELAGERHNLIFTGSMDWLPNEDAIKYFIAEIMPLVKQSVPDVTLTVVGRNPSPHLIDLSKRDTSITVTGRVEDVRPYIDSAAAYIVPIRIGGGTRLKIYEAMAMEKAIVSTTVGAEGLPVRDQQELLLADTPAAFAEATARLLLYKDFARELGLRAAAAVRERFSWRKVAEEFAQICQSAIKLGSAGRSVMTGMSRDADLIA
ncbi:MAG: glycosyltransferase [Acidobacteriota bacterium]|nr:glycosyltransferase [Acidobacteriota bacterium]